MDEKIRDIEEYLALDRSDGDEEYICLLAGQPSSGKSRFVNHLIGFECLPVGICGMTDVPTLIKKGTDRVEALYADTWRRFPMEKAKELKKGVNTASRIRIYLDHIHLPDEVSMIDMPGINSIDDKYEEGFRSCLKKSQMVFYFLGKALGQTDTEYLDEIYRSGAGLTIIRTRIDQIKQSEESVESVIEEERRSLKRLYPDAKTYFISLEDGNGGYQLQELEDYVTKNLYQDMKKAEIEKKKRYLQGTLKRKLLLRKEEIMLDAAEKDARQSKERIERLTRKKTRNLRRNLEIMEEEIISGLEEARRNYCDLGRRFIEKQSRERELDLYLLQSFIKKQMELLEEWYTLEIKDSLKMAGMRLREERDSMKKICSYLDLEQIMSGFEKQKNELFISWRYYSEIWKKGDQNQTLSMEEAISYMQKCIKMIFSGIFQNFHRSYAKWVEQIMLDYMEKTDRENLVIERILEDKSNEDRMIEKIDSYIGVIDTYVYG